MTNEEIRLISDYRIVIAGSTDFTNNIKTELYKSGFKSITIISSTDWYPDTVSVDMIIEYVGDCISGLKDNISIPIIYPFDFVYGAGAIVIKPDDKNELHHKSDMRFWIAEYMAGYCAFWNIEGCEWLYSALSAIREGKTSEAALKTAAHVCARIAVNIAVNRKVKYFPKFYLCRNLD